MRKEYPIIGLRHGEHWRFPRTTAEAWPRQHTGCVAHYPAPPLWLRWFWAIKRWFGMK